MTTPRARPACSRRSTFWATDDHSARIARDKLLRRGAEFFRVVGRLETARGALVAGIEYANGQTRAHLAGQGVSGVAEIAEVLPIQVIDPGVHRLIEEGSARRRRLLDWGVFHVKHEFLRTVAPVSARALQQRNAALPVTRTRPKWLPPGRRELMRLRRGCRSASCQLTPRSLKPVLRDASLPELLEHARHGLTYRRGWPADADSAQRCSGMRDRETCRLTDHNGRARIEPTSSFHGRRRSPPGIGYREGSRRCSPRRSSLLSSACRAAEQLPRACLMLDDPAAELDVDNLGKLLDSDRRNPLAADRHVSARARSARASNGAKVSRGTRRIHPDAIIPQLNSRPHHDRFRRLRLKQNQGLEGPRRGAQTAWNVHRRHR